jgi:hypothetical protein
VDWRFWEWLSFPFHLDSSFWRYSTPIKISWYPWSLVSSQRYSICISTSLQRPIEYFLPHIDLHSPSSDWLHLLWRPFRREIVFQGASDLSILPSEYLYSLSDNSLHYSPMETLPAQHWYSFIYLATELIEFSSWELLDSMFLMIIEYFIFLVQS